MTTMHTWRNCPTHHTAHPLWSECPTCLCEKAALLEPGERFSPAKEPGPLSKLSGSNGAYYTLPAHAEQLQDLIEHKDMNFSIGNIFKAAYRLGGKPGTTEVYDLEKIIFYAQRELDRISGP